MSLAQFLVIPAWAALAVCLYLIASSLLRGRRSRPE